MIAAQSFQRYFQLFGRTQGFVKEEPFLPAQFAGAAHPSEPFVADSKAQLLSHGQTLGEQVDCVHPCTST
jgi:hypothetical protein